MTYDKFQGNEKHGFTLSLGDTFLEKLQEGSNWPPPAFLGVKIFWIKKKFPMILWYIEIIYWKFYIWRIINGYCPRTKKKEMTFLVEDVTRHWLSRSNLF